MGLVTATEGREAKAGLLPKNREVHLYHATKAARVVYTEAEEEALKADGYQEEYIPQQYPKYLADIDKTATSKGHEDYLRGVLIQEAADPVPGAPIVKVGI